MSAGFQHAPDQLRDVLAGTSLPFFVARLAAGRVLEIGSLDRAGAGTLRRSVEAHLRRHNVGLAVRVTLHDAARLAKKRSLEALLSATGRGALVFDRTRALQRAESLVRLAQLLRSSLGDAADGVFFQSERRTLFIVLSGSARDASSAARAEMMSRIAAVEMAWRASHADHDFELALRVGFELPAGIEVIAVDRKTVRTALLAMLRRPLRSRFSAAVIGSIIGASIGMPALAADLPSPARPQSSPVLSNDAAVSEPNLSVSVLGGTARDPVNFDHLWAGLGAKATVPLGQSFGAQLDVGIATDSYYGAALHFFARNPQMGLIGVVGSVENQYGVSMNRIGAEAEYYLSDNLTVSGRAGYQSGTAPNGGFGRVDLKFYPDPNLKLSAGAEIQPSFTLGRIGVEWRPAASSLAGMSISADASASSNGDYRTMFGLHFQLGGGADAQTLIGRDRRADPGEAIFNQIDVTSAVPQQQGSTYGSLTPG